MSLCLAKSVISLTLKINKSQKIDFELTLYSCEQWEWEKFHNNCTSLRRKNTLKINVADSNINTRKNIFLKDYHLPTTTALTV